MGIHRVLWIWLLERLRPGSTPPPWRVLREGVGEPRGVLHPGFYVQKRHECGGKYLLQESE